MAKLDVFSMNKDKVGSVDLDPSVFEVEVKSYLLHDAVRYQMAKRRQGTHSVKRRSDVRGGGKKPYKQKGTGRARQGTIRAPQWRGGGVVFGPDPRDHSHDMNKKERRAALKCALSKRLADESITVIDDLKLDGFKTKDIVDLMARFDFANALFVTSDAVFAKSAKNLASTTVVPSEGVNVYDVLNRDNLVMTQGAIDALTARLAG